MAGQLFHTEFLISSILIFTTIVNQSLYMSENLIRRILQISETEYYVLGLQHTPRYWYLSVNYESVNRTFNTGWVVGESFSDEDFNRFTKYHIALKHFKEEHIPQLKVVFYDVLSNLDRLKHLLVFQ